MSKESKAERERLREQYKKHYRKMRKAKERYSRAQKKNNIVQALKDMDKSQMLESFDGFLDSVKQRVATLEARLDVAMEGLGTRDSTSSTATEEELDEQMKRMRARESLK